MPGISDGSMPAKSYSVAFRAASKAKGLEAGIAVVENFAPRVVVHTLDDFAGVGVDGQAHATQMIADDAVGFAILVHGFGDVGFIGVVVEGF